MVKNYWTGKKLSPRTRVAYVVEYGKRRSSFSMDFAKHSTAIKFASKMRAKGKTPVKIWGYILKKGEHV